MSKSSLPLDEHMVYPFHPYQKGTPLQVVRWAGERVFSTVTASSQSLVLPSATLIEISSTENCYIRFGTGAPTASASVDDDTNRLYMAGVQVVPVPIDPSTGVAYTHIACIRVADNGLFQVESLL